MDVLGVILVHVYSDLSRVTDKWNSRLEVLNYKNLIKNIRVYKKLFYK